MNRWQQEYSNFIEAGIWEQIQKHATEINLNSIEDINQKHEAFRLVKTVTHISGLLEAIDPTLMVQGTWNNLTSYAQSCLSAIKQLNYRAANDHFDRILETICPFITSSKTAAAAAGKAFRNYSDAIDTAFKELQANRETLNKLTDDFDNLHKYLLGNEPFETGEAVENLKSKFDEAHKDFERYSTEIKSFHSRLLVNTEESEPSLSVQIESAKDRIDHNKKVIDDYCDEIEEPIKNLQGFYDRIFGKKDEEGSREGGLKAELDERETQLNEFEKEQKKIHENLKTQIEGLLPGATSAGLASAFKSLKDEKKNEADKYGKYFFWCLSALIFIGVTLIVVELFTRGEDLFLASEHNANYWLNRFLIVLPVVAPLLWLAIFFSKRRSESNRLREEYAHKEALAKSFESYKKQIEALGGGPSEILELLLKISVQELENNPSHTLENAHGDKLPIQEVTKNVIGSGMKG